MSKFRTESDSMGNVEIPATAMWGAQTERARQNFLLSSYRFPKAFITALARVKYAAAHANAELEVIQPEQAQAIKTAAGQIIAGQHHDQFPLDIFQTGSGTSTNMNMNEVISQLAKNSGASIHPNDQVNASQSSNDVIPTSILVSVATTLVHDLIPALQHLRSVIQSKADSLQDVVKTGRTHLMDAMPITLAQELLAWDSQVAHCQAQLEQQMKLVCTLPQGGTAVGSGINADPQFGKLVCSMLADTTGIPFTSAENKFAGIAGQEVNLLVAGTFNSLAAVLLKISNDLRWMNSGPLAGLGEISLTALQPGSSIMPGKVNPVIPEAVAMIAAHVNGNYAAVSTAAQQGNFQLNVMLPLIALKQLESIELLSNAARSLADQAIADFSINQSRIDEALARNPILVTALNSHIGYDQAAKIAKQAYQEQRPIIDVAAEMTDIPRSELEQLLDPKKLTNSQ
ncbi:aspartate ammonia-lyase [Pseudidiomarina aestuarii]|uniref:Fumarate hydratase class II n=1 Tax=Pseudidiomarina aestuarii TaxID=624146 RepID=A0A7Z6ZW56_9GAMM|nr:class II fumarate hydratase [Pseudidiomarina aestuarii]RUO42301.1 aspartate ammonia-lyase [Pseudidiomarina aestuarii]